MSVMLDRKAGEGLSLSDIDTLPNKKRPEDRMKLAGYLAGRMVAKDLKKAERDLAQRLLRALSNDVSVMVRGALAKGLRGSADLPYEIAIQFAFDDLEIAAPILAESPVLKKQDLIELALALPEDKKRAMAKRDGLPKAVSEIIGWSGGRAAILDLISNPRAKISRSAYGDILARFPGDAGIHQALISRHRLPKAVIRNLAALMPAEQRNRLLPGYAQEASEGAQQGGGAAADALDPIVQSDTVADLGAFIYQLAQSGELTPSLVVRAACTGHLPFTEHALAEMAGIPHQRAVLMLHDAGTLGLQTLLERAAIPKKLLGLFESLVQTYHDLEREGAVRSRAQLRRQVLNRTLSEFQLVPKKDLDYVLSKVSAVQ